MEHAAKSLGARFHLPGTSGRQSSNRQGAQSPRLSPRTEKDQPTLTPLEAAGTGTTTSSISHNAQPQHTRKPATRTSTVDGSTAGGHGSPAQPSAPLLAQMPNQLPVPTRTQPSAQLPPLAPPPVLDPRKSVNEHLGTRAPRGHDTRATEREANINNRETNSSNREAEPNQREVEAHQAEVYLRNWEKSLDKRREDNKRMEAGLKEREDKVASSEDRLRHFESSAYEQEVLSIRKHMQVNDIQEVSTIVEHFRRITRRVEDISRDLGERLFDSQATRELKTADFIKILPHRPATISIRSLPVDPEDFIDFSCRALLNNWLFESICGPHIFHPGLAREQDAMLLSTYQMIRKQEPQTIAGRWRVSTFNAYQSHAGDPQELAQKFCQHALTPLCGYIYKPEAYTGPVNLAFDAIKELFRSALDWTALAKSSVVMLDFEPVFLEPGSTLDPQWVQLEVPGNHPPNPDTVLLTSKLGLRSSRAVGGSKDPERSSQIDAKALTAEYFS